MRIFHFSIILLISSLILTACVPESENPISDPAKATVDKRLLGVWAGKMSGEKEDQYIHFVEAENSITEVVLVSHQKKRGPGVSFYKMYPTTIGKNQYMNVKSSVPDDLKSPEQVKKLESHGYFFTRYRISEKGILKIWIMMDEEVSEAVKNGQLKGKIAKGDGDVTITDTRENIIKFIEADHKKDIFELIFTFQKFDADIVGNEGKL